MDGRREYEISHAQRGGRGPHVPGSRACSIEHFDLLESDWIKVREAFLMPSFPKIDSSCLICFLTLLT
jgi:hypothetical protein